MKAICIKEFIKDKYKFEKGKEYEYDEIIVYAPDYPTSLRQAESAKVMPLRLAFSRKLQAVRKSVFPLILGTRMLPVGMMLHVFMSILR